MVRFGVLARFHGAFSCVLVTGPFLRALCFFLDRCLVRGIPRLSSRCRQQTAPLAPLSVLRYERNIAIG